MISCPGFNLATAVDVTLGSFCLIPRQTGVTYGLIVESESKQSGRRFDFLDVTPGTTPRVWNATGGGFSKFLVLAEAIVQVRDPFHREIKICSNRDALPFGALVFHEGRVAISGRFKDRDGEATIVAFCVRTGEVVDVDTRPLLYATKWQLSVAVLGGGRQTILEVDAVDVPGD